MIILRLRCFLAYGLLAGGLIACSERLNPIPPDPTADQLRVKSITQELPNSPVKVSAFRYDAQNRLQAITTYELPDSSRADVERSLYQYDSQNRLIQMRRELVRRLNTGQPNPVEQYNYTYNALGQVAALAYMNGFTLAFTYADANRLTSRRIFS